MTTDPATDAVTVIETAVARRFAELVDRFAPGLRTMVTADTLQAGWDQATGRLGALTDIGEPVVEADGVVKVPVTFTDGAVAVVISMAGSGDLVGIQLAPVSAMSPQEWEPPPYADTSRFTEHDLMLGDNALAVPGTMTVPDGDGPGVVILAGSGPNDRDGTIGPSKPLKDLAWGLASRGIAVVRFDKVTHAHPAEVVKDPNFTALDEYRAAALAAIARLPGPTVLLGHSLGGSIAPRIAAEVGDLAGVVLFAAGAEPLHWSAVRQVRHLAELGSADAAPVIDAMTEQARRVDDPGLTAETPANLLPFGLPAPYWLDLRDHDQVRAAANLTTPMLVVNGGRDYQVTLADDLARWRAGLAHRTDVTFREYPADNHFFFPGDQPSSPEEYQRPHHVDHAVVADIASWVSALGG